MADLKLFYKFLFFVYKMQERYKILLLSSFIILCFCFAYDIPSSLVNFIDFGDNSKKEYRFTLLYSVYAFPNIIMPLIFGYASTFSVDIVSTVLCFLVFLGNFIFTVGIFQKNFMMMIVGRFIFGIGGESFSVIQNRLISKEFKSKDMSFAMSLFSSIARCGTILNFVLSPFLANSINIMVPCLISLFLTFIGCILSIYLNYRIRNSTAKNEEPLENLVLLCDIEEDENTSDLEKQNSNREESFANDQKYEKVANINFYDRNNITKSVNKKQSEFKSIFFNSSAFESPFAPWESVERDFKDESKEKLEKSQPKTCIEKNNTLFYEPDLRKENSYHPTFVILVTISFTFAIIWAPFYAIAPLLFKKRYDLNSVQSGHMLAIIEVMGLVMNPLVGTAADNFGFKLIFVLFGSFFLIIAHITIFYKIVPIYISVMLLGFSGPLIGCYWPCIPSIVSEKYLTKGFAIIYCVLNLAFTFSPLIFATFVVKSRSYDYVEIYIIVVSVVVTFLVTFLIYLNSKLKLGLNKRSSHRIRK